jgi:hypothetical protein
MVAETEEKHAMCESTSDILLVPLLTSQDMLTELPRDGDQRLLSQAIENEVGFWIDDHAHHKDDQGHRQVVRNGTSLGGLSRQASVP